MGDTAQNLLPEMCQSWIENLFDDPDRVMFEALQTLQGHCTGRTIGGRPAGDVLQDRMNMLPKPERVALASFIVAAHCRVLALFGKWVPRDADGATQAWLDVLGVDPEEPTEEGAP